jgi:F0F1-type ATP synthase membrane subunit a
MYVYVIFLLTLSSSLTSYFYVLLYLFLAISFVLALKLFVYYSLIAANIILVYIFGFVVISINFVSSLMSFGLLTLSFYLYLFLSVYYSFLLVLFLIELFSSFFNSLTLTNRLSINIFVGSLLINLLSLLSSAFGCLILAVFFIYESLNLLFQSFIFLLLSFFYLSAFNSVLCLRYLLSFQHHIFSFWQSLTLANSVYCNL